MSAQNCGCDPTWMNPSTLTLGYRCARHREEEQMKQERFDSEQAVARENAMKDTVPAIGYNRERAELPKNPTERKQIPVVSGVLDYFPDAIAEIARVSFQGNEQHNPGQPLHWAREKSTDHADCIGRHLLQRGDFDTDGMRHSAKMAWRALALLQIELEQEAK